MTYQIRATFFTNDSRLLKLATPAEVKRDGYSFPLTPNYPVWTFPTMEAAESKRRILVRHFGEDLFLIEPTEHAETL